MEKLHLSSLHIRTNVSTFSCILNPAKDDRRFSQRTASPYVVTEGTFIPRNGVDDLKKRKSPSSSGNRITRSLLLLKKVKYRHPLDYYNVKKHKGR